MNRYVLFDLDGTLTDPGIGITNSVRYALEQFGIHPGSREELFPYIGPPLTGSFQKYHHLSPEQATEALRLYRVYFTDKGLYENEVYAGIPEMLEQLNKEGFGLIIATSKPEEFTHIILNHFLLERYFLFVGGNTLDERRPDKTAVIAYIREQFPDITDGNTVMVGDREYDMTGANENNLSAIGVSYGYGTREELERAGSWSVAENPERLAEEIRRFFGSCS